MSPQLRAHPLVHVPIDNKPLQITCICHTYDTFVSSGLGQYARAIIWPTADAFRASSVNRHWIIARTSGAPLGLSAASKLHSRALSPVDNARSVRTAAELGLPAENELAVGHRRLCVPHFTGLVAQVRHADCFRLNQQVLFELVGLLVRTPRP